MNIPETTNRAAVRGAVIGATLFFALGVAIHSLMDHQPSLVWMGGVFGLAGGVVGYLGMNKAQGVIGATLGLAICLVGGAILGDEVGGFIPVERPESAPEGRLIEIAGPTLDGKTFNIADWRGKVVLVDFWATWCPPCVAEMPNLKRIYDRFHKDGFEIVGVSLDNDRTALENFVKKRELPWPQIFFTEPSQQGWTNPLARTYNVNSIPTTFLLDREGRVAPTDREDASLESLVRKQLTGNFGFFRMGLLVGACIGGFFGCQFGDFLERLIRGKRGAGALPSA
jgi:thiol-disulfide isomerase/thioredoxin